MRWLLLAITLPGCAAWHRLEQEAWRKHGACGIVCDYRMGYMSTSYTLNPFQCRCYSPTLRDLVEKREGIQLQSYEGVELCCGGCKQEAEAILARQPWRRPPDMPPFDDPFPEISQ